MQVVLLYFAAHYCNLVQLMMLILLNLASSQQHIVALAHKGLPTWCLGQLDMKAIRVLVFLSIHTMLCHGRDLHLYTACMHVLQTNKMILQRQAKCWDKHNIQGRIYAESLLRLPCNIVIHQCS